MAASSNTLVQQFARAPRVGAVKTRLQPPLTASAACALHCELVRWTSATLGAAGFGEVELWVTGSPDDALFQDCLDLGMAAIRQQQGRDLGARMLFALDHGLARYPQVLLVGSDCPGLDADYLHRAATALQHSELVLGPARDGGYVLLGARRPVAPLFTDMPWGTDRVLAQTLQWARSMGLVTTLLEPLTDIDRPADLPHWQALRAAGSRSGRSG
ncbi:TIGR04282 family arsenosugar biosynthesis glycosyltransferase [Kineobactrum salinum]|uniref:Glycosyltransferase n=1 Tax=Kineobactrum salinum TaxID=2708301 RepID=A0A6C0U503_9GAMM|nr:TIGR04282 family arsenosugar biosynthesis glycosyltransferase [Kineobactrum salinum]QIB67242.1 glycosyltransferase [Kineobactrum salinum]